jgi:rhamnose transport system ATP-binding protein
VGARIDVDREAASLSLPEQQLLEIARALGAKAKLLILDEPTASLTPQEVDRLFALLGALRAAGTAIVYITHRLDELPRLADRVTVLRDGTTVGTEEMKGVVQARLIQLMVGREVATVFPSGRCRLARRCSKSRASARARLVCGTCRSGAAARSSASPGWSAPDARNWRACSLASSRRPPAV